MGAMASQITGISIVYSTVCSDADQRKYQSSALLAFVKGIHRKIFPFEDAIMSAIVGRGWFYQRLVLKFRREPLRPQSCHDANFVHWSLLELNDAKTWTNVKLVVTGGTGGYHNYAKFVVIDGTRRWHHDNLRSHQWQQSCHLGFRWRRERYYSQWSFRAAQATDKWAVGSKACAGQQHKDINVGIYGF